MDLPRCTVLAPDAKTWRAETTHPVNTVPPPPPPPCTLCPYSYSPCTLCTIPNPPVHSASTPFQLYTLHYLHPCFTLHHFQHPSTPNPSPSPVSSTYSTLITILSMKYRDLLLLFKTSFSANNNPKHVFSRAPPSLLSRHYLSITHALSTTSENCSVLVSIFFWKELTAWPSVPVISRFKCPYMRTNTDTELQYHEVAVHWPLAALQDILVAP